MKVPYSVSRTIARSVLQLKRQSPHLFFAGGVAGVMGSTVLACRATLKLEKTLDEIKIDLETTPDDPREKGETYGRAAYKIGKLYAPSAALGLVSIGALAGSHVQLTKRNNALAATLAGVTKAYDAYRERVREELGEERELELYRDIREEKGEDGKKHKVVGDPTRHSVYAKCFDESNPNWTKDPELNRLFIQAQQSYWNNVLHSRGHVFLNEVYENLGIDHTKAGSVVGWMYGGDGDNYIDFGIFDDCKADFVNGQERSIWLDFNVDGAIWTHLKD